MLKASQNFAFVRTQNSVSHKSKMKFSLKQTQKLAKIKALHSINEQLCVGLASK